MNVAGQPALLGVVELDTTTTAPALTLEGIGATSVFNPPYLDSSNTNVTSPLVQIGGGYNASSDYDADGRSDDLDNCPFTPNTSQENNGGFLATIPDHLGDDCQCGDASGDGSVFSDDIGFIRSALASETPDSEIADRCSVSGDEGCDVLDFVILSRALSGLGPGIGIACIAATGGAVDG